MSKEKVDEKDIPSQQYRACVGKAGYYLVIQQDAVQETEEWLSKNSIVLFSKSVKNNDEIVGAAYYFVPNKRNNVELDSRVNAMNRDNADAIFLHHIGVVQKKISKESPEVSLKGHTVGQDF